MATLTKDFSLTLSLPFPPHLLTLSLTYHTSIMPVEMFEEAQCELVLLPPHKDPMQVAEVRFRCLQKEVQAQAPKKHPVLKRQFVLWGSKFFHLRLKNNWKKSNR